MAVLSETFRFYNSICEVEYYEENHDLSVYKNTNDYNSNVKIEFGHNEVLND